MTSPKASTNCPQISESTGTGLTTLWSASEIARSTDLLTVAARIPAVSVCVVQCHEDLVAQMDTYWIILVLAIGST